VKALLLNDAPGNDKLYDAELRAAGFDVVRCSPPGTASFPCVGMHGDCPLDASVDVAVVVHERPTPSFSAGEVGVVCALRDGVPLVVAGNGATTPFREEADAVAADALDVADACHRAVSSQLARTGRKVGGEVDRQGDVVRLELGPEATEADAVRAHRALRSAFPAARVIDVGTGGPPS
jgi:hypothetical protein